MAESPVVSNLGEGAGTTGRPELHRSIGPFQMTLYGLGSMLGSGVYGLMGQAAGLVGNAGSPSWSPSWRPCSLP